MYEGLQLSKAGDYRIVVLIRKVQVSRDTKMLVGDEIVYLEEYGTDNLLL